MKELHGSLESSVTQLKQNLKQRDVDGSKMTLQVQVSCSCSLVVTKTTFHYQYMVSLPLIWLNAMGVCLTNMLCYFIISSISLNCMKSMRMPPIVTNAWSVCLLVRFGPLADHAGVINNFIVLYNRAQYKNG